MKKLVLQPEKLPISFTLGETVYKGMPADCAVEKDGIGITYTAMLGNLEVKAVCRAYEDFDASEWTVYFTNKGQADSARLHRVYAIDTLFAGENHKIYTCNGDFWSEDGYATTETHLADGAELVQAPVGGRSCDRAFPYQRILFEGRGHNIAIGWPGQWESRFRGTEEGVTYRAGQQILDTVVRPGETLRTPLIVVVSFEGDLERGINVWRRWYLKHVGIAKPYLHGNYAPEGTLEFTQATEENQIAYIRKAKAHGIDINLWWLDAGWYECKNANGDDDWWSTVGEWTCDKKRFPRGLAPVAEECEKNGLDFLVWFEAERVTEKTAVVKEHPEWIIVDETNPVVKMLDLSQPDCCDYLIRKIGDVIAENKIKVYRQDYNFEPLNIWRKNETEDRKGAVENLYTQGYLRYWDALKARFPGLLIDSCASGGRRNDIETMRRGVPMHETDYGYGFHPIQQAFRQTLYTWIPYFRGFSDCWERENGEYLGRAPWESLRATPVSDSPFRKVTALDEYHMIMMLAPMTSFSAFTMRDMTEEEYAVVRDFCKLFYKVAPTFSTADFYALTPYHKSRFRWTAWQFDVPEENRGLMEVFRNNGAAQETLTVRPRLPEGTYRFENLRTGESFVFEGGELTFAQPIRSAAIWEYKKL